MPLSKKESIIIGFIVSTAIIIIVALISWYFCIKKRFKKAYSQIEDKKDEVDIVVDTVDTTSTEVTFIVNNDANDNTEQEDGDEHNVQVEEEEDNEETNLIEDDKNVSPPIHIQTILSPSSKKFKRIKRVDSHSFFALNTHKSHITTEKSNLSKRNESVWTDLSYSDDGDDSTCTCTCSTSVYSQSWNESKQDVKSWNVYKQNLQRLFYCFAGYQPINIVENEKEKQQKEAISISCDETKRFLEIIQITNVDNCSVDEILKIMSKDCSQMQVSLSQFVGYFINVQINPKVNQIKKHIEKQICWKLLLKTLNIFDVIDVNHCGHLQYDGFKQFAKMFNLNEKETQIFWNKMDENKCGQVTVIDLFSFLKTAIQAQRQQNVKKTSSSSIMSTCSDEETEFTQFTETYAYLEQECD